MGSVGDSNGGLGSMAITIVSSNISSARPSLGGEIINDVSFAGSSARTSRCKRNARITNIVIRGSPGGIGVGSCGVTSSGNGDAVDCVISTLGAVTSRRGTPGILGVSLIIGIANSSADAEGCFRGIISRLSGGNYAVISTTKGGGRSTSDCFPTSVPRMVAITTSSSCGGGTACSGCNSIISVTTPNARVCAAVVNNNCAGGMDNASLTAPFMDTTTTALLSVSNDLGTDRLRSGVGSTTLPVGSGANAG